MSGENNVASFRAMTRTAVRLRHMARKAHSDAVRQGIASGLTAGEATRIAGLIAAAYLRGAADAARDALDDAARRNAATLDAQHCTYDDPGAEDDAPEPLETSAMRGLDALRQPDAFAWLAPRAIEADAAASAFAKFKGLFGGAKA
jgi:hypothetical protein